MPENTSDTLLAAGLLNICKHLLGRVRVLEEMVAADPEMAARWMAANRFQAAFEEDEYSALKQLLRDSLSMLEEANTNGVSADEATD